MSVWPAWVKYNKIVVEHFVRHRIVQRMDAVDKLTKMCGFPSPPWLAKMINTLHNQMDEIRRHAEKKCRKILRPDDVFGPPIQYWYDKIHAFRQLIRRSEGKNVNNTNTLRFARRKEIENPEDLSVDQLKDGLQYARQRKKQLKETTPGLRKVHLRNMLIEAQEKGQSSREKGIKAKIEGEHMNRMWYLIKRVTKDPQSPAILKVQRVANNKVMEYNDQASVNDAIQRECKVCFELAHSAPISKSLLDDKLRYLSDEAIALDIILGWYEPPEDMDEATKDILEEIGRMGMKIMAGDKEIILSPDNFERFWRRVNKYTSSSASGLHYRQPHTLKCLLKYSRSKLQ